MTYVLRKIDPAIVARAKVRARDAGSSLDDVLRAYVTAYADGHDTPAQLLGATGGTARAARMSARARQQSARRAAQARWARPAEQ